MKNSPCLPVLAFVCALLALILVPPAYAQTDLSPKRLSPKRLSPKRLSPKRLSPKHWGEAELEKYVRTEHIAEPVVRAEHAMVSGTSSPIAQRAGLEALKQGGTAMDAALVVALTHTTLAGNCTVSMAGVITVVYYDAESGEVYALDGGYKTVKGEKDPATIPLSSRIEPSQRTNPIPKGRTVLVPGFMAGLEAAHMRFGKLPFAEIFEPAIYFAEKGFPISAGLSRMTESYKPFLTRLPATRAVYYKNDGGIYAPGEIFRQPALARTLRRVAEKGSAYMYRGAWAHEFVEAVRRDGGKMTLEDLDSYRPQWIDPVSADLGGHRVYMAGGGLRMAGMLNMLDISGLASRDHYAESPDSFYWFCRIVKAAQFGDGLDGEGLGKEEWRSREFAEKAWNKLQNARGAGADGAGEPVRDESAGDDPARDDPARSRHSDAVVVADASGNVAALLHSSNTRGFGETGLCIGGIAIPDSATFQQAALSFVEPGERFFNPTVPLIVMKDGKPVAGLSAIGSGIYEESVKCLFNILCFGKGSQEAIDAPGCVPTFTDAVNAPSSSIAVAKGWYPDAVLEGARKMGLAIEALPFEKARRTKGAAAIITLDPATGFLKAGSARRFSLGY